MRYDVVEVLDEHPVFGVMRKSGGRVEGVLATPRLISEGTQRPVEAYQTTDVYHPERYPGGLWRMRDDSYDPPGTKYRRVIIEVIEE